MSVTHIMLDLETMGTRPGAIIRAVAAVKFTVEEGIVDRLYFPVCSNSCEALGMAFDGDTVQWWLAQDDSARRELLRPAADIRSVLGVLSWFCDVGPTEKLAIWGCGANFDPPLLEWAYRAASLPVPWSFLDVRCYRTLKGLFPDQRQRGKVAHHALKDAEWQAEHTLKVLRTLAYHSGPRESGVDAVPGGEPMSQGNG